jgi:hypothetical protein
MAIKYMKKIGPIIIYTIILLFILTKHACFASLDANSIQFGDELKQVGELFDIYFTLEEKCFSEESPMLSYKIIEPHSLQSISSLDQALLFLKSRAKGFEISESKINPKIYHIRDLKMAESMNSLDKPVNELNFKGTIVELLPKFFLFDPSLSVVKIGVEERDKGVPPKEYDYSKIQVEINSKNVTIRDVLDKSITPKLFERILWSSYYIPKNVEVGIITGPATVFQMGRIKN